MAGDEQRPGDGAGEPENEPKKNRTAISKAASWAVALATIALIAALLGQRSEGARFLELVQQVRPGWLALGLLLQVATFSAGGLVLHRVLRSQDVHIGLAQLVRLVLARRFTDQALPSAGLGGTLVLVQGLDRRGVQRSAAMGAVVLDLVGFYAALALAFAAALAVVYARGELNGAILLGTAAFAVLALSIPALLIRLSARGREGAPRWLLRFGPGRGLVDALAETPSHLLGDRRLVATVTGLHVLVVALDTTSLWAMLQAVGHGELAVAYASHVLATIAGILSLLPGGLGAFEGGAIAVLTAMGVGLEVAVAATLLDRMFTFWLPMIPGLLFARHETRARPVATEDDPQTERA